MGDKNVLKMTVVTVTQANCRSAHLENDISIKKAQQKKRGMVDI